MKRAHVSALAAALVLSATSGEAHAQFSTPRYVDRTAGRLSLEAFITQYRLEGDRGGDRLAHHAIGGRIMWSLAPRTDPTRGTLATRTSLGGFIIHTPESQTELRTSHYGAQADVRMLRSPLAGRLDPMVSLGVGAFRTEGARVQFTRVPGTSILTLADRQPVAEFPREHFTDADIVTDVEIVRHSTTSLAVTPGLGARVAVAPGFAVRGDIRDVLVFRAGVRHNVEVSAGFSLTL